MPLRTAIAARFVALICSLLACAAVSAQQTDSTDNNAIDGAIEDLIQTTESSGDIDFTFITDQLTDFRRNPLNLNAATVEQLETLPGLNDVKIAALERHLSRYGKLLSLYELQAIEGWDMQTIRAILPYVGVVEPIQIRGKWRSEYTQRTSFLTEQQRGYSPKNIATNDTNRYVGSGQMHYTRVRMRYGNQVSFALTGEKDRGEAFTWQPKQRQYGYDFLSFHAALSNLGPLKSLVIGDYTIQAAQGMVLSRGLGIGKGAAAVNNIKQPNVGIRPYASVNEALYMRGVAAAVAITKRLTLTGFVSRTSRDANITALADSTDNEQLANGGGFSSSDVQVGGFHRTRSELGNRHTLMETILGGRAEYRKGTFSVGTTHYMQQFDKPLAKSPTFYNQFDFRGNANQLMSADVDFVWRNFNFFGEIARSTSGGIGAVGGLIGSLHRTLDVAVLARNYDANFHSMHGFVFAERPRGLQNERGIYTGFLLKPTRRWNISGYIDQYYFAQPTFSAAFPSNGYEYLAQVEYLPLKNTSVYIRLRSDNKQQNAATDALLEPIRTLAPVSRNNLRIHFRHKISTAFQLASRAEWTWYAKGGQQAQGFVAYQDATVRSRKWGSLTGRYAIFNAPDYNGRIYAYENEVQGFFSIPAYYGIGSRYYLIWNYQPSRHVEFWARIAQTYLQNADIRANDGDLGNRYVPLYSNGNGLETIYGNTRTEIKLQVRFYW